MLIFALVAFIVFGVVNTAVLAVMKIQVNQRASAEDQISWWVHDTKNEIGRKYGEIFPESILPGIGRITTWICFGLFAAMICSAFVSK
jgi:hypothetical protein